MFKGGFKIPPGADVNARDESFRAPVHYAVMHNKIDAFLTLVHAKANVDTVAMSYAARYSNFEMTTCLLATVPNLLREHYAIPPLLVAVQHFNAGAVLALLKAGVSPNVYPWYERSPLMYALRNDLPTIVEILVDAGAVDDEALDYALEHRKDAYVKRLIPATSKSALDKSVLVAVQHADVSTVRVLLDARASPDKHSPLTVALSRGREYTRLLLEYGASPFVYFENVKIDTLQLLNAAQLRILEDNRRTEIACFIACYRPLRYTEEEGAIDERFIHPLAHLTWAYGVRPIRKRLVAYLVEKNRRNALLVSLRAFS